jgi:hypothetical protein
MGGNAPTGPPPALVARVNEKRAELEHLKELRELSAAMASQMEALEQKLSTLSDGTEGTFHQISVPTPAHLVLTAGESNCDGDGQLE